MPRSTKLTGEDTGADVLVPSMHSSVSMLVDENLIYAMLRAASLDIAMLCDLGHINILVDVRMIRGKMLVSRPQ